MTSLTPNVFNDFEEFYDANEPDNAGQLLDLYRSVTDVSDEDFFETEELSGKPKATHKVTAASGDILYLTAKSYPAFIKFIESKNDHEDLDIETAAAYEYAINNPNS